MLRLASCRLSVRDAPDSTRRQDPQARTCGDLARSLPRDDCREDRRTQRPGNTDAHPKCVCLNEWPRTESYIDPGLVGAAGDRKVRTKEELEAAIKEPRGVAPTRNVWIHESLEDEARRVWEEVRRTLL